jgi:hypothetical protein
VELCKYIQEQAQNAKFIKDFLVQQILQVDPYSQVNPDVEPEAEPNRRALVKRIARAVDTEFADRPEVEAELRMALAAAAAALDKKAMGVEIIDVAGKVDYADYLVLADAWDRTHPHAPELEGQLFHMFEAPNRFGLPAFYTLHVWAWKANPTGMFVNWHSNVSCTSYAGNQ